ncbi:Hypothetical predicted protein [Olea europaea subsp. europaea]|uniref:Uncharacterized protein n=1 Tax=Olea europaea subsp. europaea TaxID=158383 RepID=A0A8S0TD36_OLEEU|nr:Hypothetical predicted protein [Olea europaea subsp. europaea]
MDGVLYNKPQKPSLSRHSRSSKINRTVKKSKPHILMITDGQLGHLSDIKNDDEDNDDDFIDPPLRQQRKSFLVRSSVDTPMEPDKIYVESSKDEGPSIHMSPSHAAYIADFELLKHEVIDLRMKNTELSTEIDDVREQLLSLMADSSHKLNIIICVSMDQILDKFKERGESKCTGAAYNQEEDKNVDASIDRKGKGKIYPDVQTFDPMNLESPSFDLEIGYIQPTPNHMDSCFYYISQLALYGENVKYKATTTDSHFQTVIKHVYPHFKKDPNVLLTDTRLINAVKARWTYIDLRVRAGVEPFVRVIPHLMRAIGLWNKDLDNHEGDSMELKIVLGYDVPQQQNGHNYDIFVIKYAEYILHNDLESMPKEFDAARARLDIAAQLYKHRDIKNATKGGNEKVEGSIVIE